jgi:hypothetical protein
MISYDETGYYLYLPAAFIYKDLGKLAFNPEITAKYNLSNNAKWYAIYDQPKTGFKLNKYAVGTSVFQLPFFLIAHVFCCQKNPYPHDGYSMPYMMAIVFANLFWLVLGLAFLRKFLLRYFTDPVTAVTLILIALGTNLFFYTTFIHGMSHTYSFAAFSLLLFATERWYSTERKGFAILIGALLGLIMITRPTNIVVALVPLLWEYKDGILKDKIGFYRRQAGSILFATLAFTAFLMLQLSYWKYVTGDWVHFSYEGEGFDFLHAQIGNGLFSYRKGWFVFTPIAFLGVLGLLPLMLQNKRLALNIFIFLGVIVYVVFSWEAWWYGGSFGCRALIEALAIVAIPLAALIQWLFSKRKLWVDGFLVSVLTFCIYLNFFQSFQLMACQATWEFNNESFYWQTFLKYNVTDDDRKLLYQK